MNSIKKFPFFDNIYKLYKTLPQEEKAQFMDTILFYMFEDKEPNNLSPVVDAYWSNIERVLSKTKSLILNGKKGGAPIGNQNAKKQSENNQINNQKTSKDTSKKQPKKQAKIQANKQRNSLEFLISNFFISNFLFLDNNNKNIINNKILEWIKYKQENNKTYKKQGLKSLLTQIENNTRLYGVENIVNLIDESMANNYQGILFDKLKKMKTVRRTEPEEWEFYEYNGVRYKRNKTTGQDIAIGVV